MQVPKNVEQLIPFTTVEENRHSLDVIRVETDNEGMTHVLASDGRCMAWYSYPSEEGNKAISSANIPIELFYPETMMTIVPRGDGHAMEPVTKGQGKQSFPPWHQVWPTKQENDRIVKIRINYLRKMLKVFDEMDGARGILMRIPKREGEAVIFERYEAMGTRNVPGPLGAHLRVLVMPLV